VEPETLRRVSIRLLPIVFLLYIASFLDRSNLAIAALEMNRDLRFSAGTYGLGAGVFFLAYALFEVPSNLVLARVGARRWIARIAITWGVIASGMMLVRTPAQFYVLRFLLGFAEAGFFPGIVYYLGQWFPETHRARALSRFMVGIPVSSAIGGPLGGWLLGFEGRFGLHGWQWLFLVEGVPAVILGLIALRYLTDTPDDARWLSEGQRAWLTEALRREQAAVTPATIRDPLRALVSPVLWLVALPPFLLYATGYAHTFWLPTVIQDTLHTSHAATGWVLGAMATLWCVTTIAGGHLSDRLGERFHVAASGAAVIAIGFAAAALAPAPWAVIAAFTLIGVGQMTYLPIFWCVPGRVLRGTGAAAGIGLVNAIASAGGFVGPYAVGLFRDATGSTTGAYALLAALAACAALGLLLLRERQGFAAMERPLAA
jgi:MFS transporter, ACS family, tartrate transporter